MSKPIHIVFFGDSICCGEGVSVHQGWVPKISEFFLKEYGDSIIVHNSSVSGDTTRTALVRMGYHIMSESRAFDIMIVQFGMNDCKRWKTERNCNRVSEGAFASNIQEIIHRGFASGISKIFVLTNHASNIKGYGEELSNYNATIRQVVDRNHSSRDNVQLIDIERELDKDYLAEDGIHLTESGNKDYFNIVLSALYDSVDRMVHAGN